MNETNVAGNVFDAGGCAAVPVPAVAGVPVRAVVVSDEVPAIGRAPRHAHYDTCGAANRAGRAAACGGLGGSMLRNLLVVLLHWLAPHRLELGRRGKR